MGRIAGSAGHYELSLVDKHGQAHGARVKLKSVTTILGALPKNGLDWWGFKLGLQAAQVITRDGNFEGSNLDELYEQAKQTDYAPHRALKAAGSRGTDVHDTAEELLRGTKTRAQVAALTDGYVDALLTWFDNIPETAEVVAVEVPLFSLTHRYSGTCDYILRDTETGVYTIGDFKTSKAIYESHLLQVAAYGEAARELGLVPRDAILLQEVVRLGNDGIVEVQRSMNTIDDFLVVKALYDLLNPPKAPKAPKAKSTKKGK